MKETAANLRAQAQHARDLADAIFDPQMKRALNDAAEQFESDAKERDGDAPSEPAPEKP